MRSYSSHLEFYRFFNAAPENRGTQFKASQIPVDSNIIPKNEKRCASNRIAGRNLILNFQRTIPYRSSGDKSDIFLTKLVEYSKLLFATDRSNSSATIEISE